MIKKLIRKAFNAFGFELHRRNDEMRLTMEGGLERCQGRGVKVNTVIDVGASDGSWTQSCLKYFPEANYLMIEAQEPHKVALDRFVTAHRNVEYVLAAAGRTEGKIYFDNSDLFGGLASEKPLEGKSVEVPVVTIDTEVQKRKLAGPYLIKLDTHGFEVPILEGAVSTIRNASLVIIETYNYRLTNDSLRYFEMCEYMKNLGFLSVEMVDFILRKKDLSFWQMDTFFIPANSKAFESQSFD